MSGPDPTPQSSVPDRVVLELDRATVDAAREIVSDPGANGDAYYIASDIVEAADHANTEDAAELYDEVRTCQWPWTGNLKTATRSPLDHNHTSRCFTPECAPECNL